jgi:hypothetical protein
MSVHSSSTRNITTGHKQTVSLATIHHTTDQLVNSILSNTHQVTNITSQIMSPTNKQITQKQQTATSPRTSMSSYDAASIMSEKERASASWREVQDKKKSKLSKLITGKNKPSDLTEPSADIPPAIKNIEPPEPVIPNRNRCAMPGWAR